MIRRLSAAATLVVLVLPPTSLAQDGPRTIEEILVTAERREASVQDTSIAITAYGFEELELRGITHGDAGYIAVGYEDPETGAASAVALHSQDGVTWERIDAPLETFDGFQAESIAFGGGIYVAVGFNIDDGTPGAVWIGTPSS